LLNENCGCITDYSKIINIDFVSESMKFNNCLNKKVAVDKNGNIKNCLSLNEVFGNLNKDSLPNIILSTKLKDKWNISKDQIKTCMDCEFRYICMDCRAYLEVPSDLKSKPLQMWIQSL